MSPPLYNRDILALAVAMTDYPRLSVPQVSGERRAPLCGSRVMLDLDFDDDGRAVRIGIAAEACALGQAAATLFARGAIGRDGHALAAAAAALASWLAGHRETPPDWPGIALLAPARAYPARHAAILLPFALAAQLAEAAMQGRSAQRAGTTNQGQAA